MAPPTTAVARQADPSQPGPVKLNFTHEALARFLLANPGPGQLSKAAEAFGYTKAWVSCIVHSDAFQALMRTLQSEANHEVIIDIPTKLRGAASLALDGLADSLEHALDSGQPILHRGFFADSAEMTLKALGYGATKITVNDNSVGKGATVAVVDQALLERARGRMLQGHSQEVPSERNPEPDA